jgi:ubiquinone/menaquinone biosynthesis C-methylase UbiE
MTHTAKEEYEQLAAIYDRRWRSYVGRSVERTMAVLSLRGAERVLDVGCGTGALLAELLKKRSNLELHGIDPSGAMLEVARQKCGSGVVFQQGNAEALPYPDHTFDLLVSVSAFHFFVDHGKAVSEIRRVLRPSGRYVITAWCADYPAMRLYARWLRFRGSSLTRLHRLSELRNLLEAKGLAVERAERFRIQPLWGMMLVTGSVGR